MTKSITSRSRFTIILSVILLACVVLISAKNSFAQTQSVFSETFSSPSSATWSFGSGVPINTSTWSIYNNGNFGARINGGFLEITSRRNSAAHGQGFAFVPCGGPSSQFDNNYYNPVLSGNSGIVTWTFNMRRAQSTSSSSGFSCSSSSSQNYITTGLGFILATNSESGILSATNNCNPNGTAVGYAVLFGGTNAPRLVEFTNAIHNGSISNIAVWGSTIGQANYMSIRVTYDPSNNQWSLQARSDGTSSFANPDAGTYGNAVTGTNSTHTSVPLNFMGGYFQSGCIGVCDDASSGYIARFDNINVTATQLCAPVQLDITGISSFCAGDQTTLSANIITSGGPILSYQWQLNGVNIPGETGPTHNATNSGFYTVIAYDSAGCQGTSPSILTAALSLPDVAIAGSFLLCPGATSSTLTANTSGGSSPVISYQWQLNGVNIPGADASTYDAPSLGDYTVIAYDANGCSGSSPSVTVIPGTLPVAGFNTSINGNAVGFLNASQSGTSYLWDFGDGTPTSTSTNPVHLYATSGSYIVSLIATNVCGSDTITQLITVGPTGISDPDQAHGLEIYPNPSFGIINLNVYVNQQERFVIHLINSLGQTLYEQVIECKTGNNTFTLNTSRLTQGNYIIRATGKKNLFQKVVMVN